MARNKDSRFGAADGFDFDNQYEPDPIEDGTTQIEEVKPTEVNAAPAAEETSATKKPATVKTSTRTKKSSSSTKNTEQAPDFDEDEIIKMTYLLPLTQVEALRLMAFNEGRYAYDILREILDKAIPSDIMDAAKVRVQNGIAKTSQKKK